MDGYSQVINITNNDKNVFDKVRMKKIKEYELLINIL